MLRYADGFSVPQIARVLEVPEPTVELALEEMRFHIRIALARVPEADERTPRPSSVGG